MEAEQLEMRPAKLILCIWDSIPRPDLGFYLMVIKKNLPQSTFNSRLYIGLEARLKKIGTALKKIFEAIFARNYGFTVVHLVQKLRDFQVRVARTEL